MNQTISFSSSQDSSCVVSNVFLPSEIVPLICENSRIFSSFSDSYLSLNSSMISCFDFFEFYQLLVRISPTSS